MSVESAVSLIDSISGLLSKLITIGERLAERRRAASKAEWARRQRQSDERERLRRLRIYERRVRALDAAIEALPAGPRRRELETERWAVEQNRIAMTRPFK